MSLEDYARCQDRPPNADINDSIRTEFIDVTQWEDAVHDNHQVTPTPVSHQAKKDEDKYGKFALIVRRRMKQDAARKYQPLPQRLEVNDPAIRSALRIVLKEVRDLNVSASPIVLLTPYRELLWFKDELLQYHRDANRTEEERASLTLLLDFINTRMSKSIDTFNQLVPHGLVTYKILWTLFRPNSVAIDLQNELPRALRVISVEYKEPSGKGPCLEICCWFWGYQNQIFGRIRTVVTVESFEGARRILDLNAYPLDCIPEQERTALHDELVSNGRKWKTLIERCHRSYNGIALKVERTVKPKPRSVFNMFDELEDVASYGWSRMHVNGRIILDQETFSQTNPGALIPLKRLGPAVDAKTIEIIGAQCDKNIDGSTERQDLQDIFKQFVKGPHYQMSDQQALLCPRHIAGYSLHDKIWAQFVVDDVKEIDWDDQCFTKLQIDAGFRQTVESLIRKHSTPGRGFSDIVVGKGKGLTFLLHGPPGSGKTLTAETVSEHTRKPLFYLTSGELGTEASIAEERLRQAFKLSQTWGAILLLDEADVFLAKRAPDDIVRNAFVSVFLRSMEYYQGIMILTTNRQDEFDDAFQSRIHLHIPYAPPDSESRAAIWKNILDSQETESQFDGDALARLGRNYELNGREIKNLILMALAISEVHGEPLSEAIIANLFALNHGGRIAQNSTNNS